MFSDFSPHSIKRHQSHIKSSGKRLFIRMPAPNEGKRTDNEIVIGSDQLFIVGIYDIRNTTATIPQHADMLYCGITPAHLSKNQNVLREEQN